MPLPPAYDDSGNPIPLDDDELYRHWARLFLMDRAGGWSPESGPGRQALAEFEAFVRETQARAVEAHERWLVSVAAVRADLDIITDGARDALAADHTHAVLDYDGDPWSAYAEHIRAGRTDLSGNRVDT